MRGILIGAAVAGALALTGARAQSQEVSPERRALLETAATVYTAVLTCPGGLDPDPTTAVAAMLAGNGVGPGDVAEGGRLYPAFRAAIRALAEEMRGKSPREACATLAARQPRWIRPRLP